ncbi:hypothetical protein IKF03_00745 [Candidatus Saccharibacteria bacterium]|nr:hypothetical protein [Candidatus Saccharibacteria bacterium]
MDYGQPTNTSNEMPFFTAGVGDVPENLNPDAKNSLNTGVYSPERDIRNLGNVAIFPSESTPNLAEQPTTKESLPQENPNKDPDAIGQIVPFGMPPDHDSFSSSTTPDLSQIARENDRISLKTIKAVEKATTDYKHDQISPAELANFKADATEAYMKTFEHPNWKGEG